MSRRWYNSAVAARRDAPMVFYVGRCLIAYSCGLAEGSRNNVGPCWALTIDGRSDAHVDRLARDWISAGVSPCRDGSRGYNYRWWLDDSRSAAAACDLHLRACLRARRVVRRG